MFWQILWIHKRVCVRAVQIMLSRRNQETQFYFKTHNFIAILHTWVEQQAGHSRRPCYKSCVYKIQHFFVTKTCFIRWPWQFRVYDIQVRHFYDHWRQTCKRSNFDRSRHVHQYNVTPQECLSLSFSWIFL